MRQPYPCRLGRRTEDDGEEKEHDRLQFGNRTKLGRMQSCLSVRQREGEGRESGGVRQ